MIKESAIQFMRQRLLAFRNRDLSIEEVLDSIAKGDKRDRDQLAKALRSENAAAIGAIILSMAEERFKREAKVKVDEVTADGNLTTDEINLFFE